jgi:hypothetical protein
VTPDEPGAGCPKEDRPRHADLETGRQKARISYDDLWLAYFSLTGSAAPIEVEAYLQGLMPLPAFQEDILAQALREAESVRGQDGDG